MRKTLYTLLLPIIVCSCTGQEDKEEEYAGRMLDAARTLMTEGNYVAAKDSILAMRETFPTAFKARATGIIVMDSIELLAAQDTLAIMDSTLRAEQEILKKLEAEKQRLREIQPALNRAEELGYPNMELLKTKTKKEIFDIMTIWKATEGK